MEIGVTEWPWVERLRSRQPRSSPNDDQI